MPCAQIGNQSYLINVVFSRADSHVYNSSFIQMLFSLSTFFIDFFSSKRGIEIDRWYILKLENINLEKRMEIIPFDHHYVQYISLFQGLEQVFLVVCASLSLKI